MGLCAIEVTGRALYIRICVAQSEGRMFFRLVCGVLAEEGSRKWQKENAFGNLFDLRCYHHIFFNIRVSAHEPFYDFQTDSILISRTSCGNATNEPIARGVFLFLRSLLRLRCSSPRLFFRSLLRRYCALFCRSPSIRCAD